MLHSRTCPIKTQRSRWRWRPCARRRCHARGRNGSRRSWHSSRAHRDRPRRRQAPPCAAVVDSLDANGVKWVMYDGVHVEPTEQSWLEAIDFARGHTFDALVGVGGGSSIDTAKAVNLYTTHPPTDFLDYVNKPIGQGLPVPGPLKPLFAIPTTAGTGSETTGVAIFDLARLHVKTGISSRLLKPTLGFLDPNHTRTAPPAVAASAGLDILCHAVESYTAHCVHRSAAARASLSEASLPGRQSDQRRLVAASHEDGGDSSRACSRRSGRRRGKSEHGAGSVICRDRLWKCRCARAARNGVSSGRRRQAVSCAWLPERPRPPPARFFGFSPPARAGFPPPARPASPPPTPAPPPGPAPPPRADERAARAPPAPPASLRPPLPLPYPRRAPPRPPRSRPPWAGRPPRTGGARLPRPAPPAAAPPPLA